MKPIHSDTKLWKMATLALLTLSSVFTVPVRGAGLYTSGHGDIDLTYEAGWLLFAHLDPSAIVDGLPVGNSPDGVEFDPADLRIFVPNPSIARPAGAAFAPIGNAAGEPLWLIPAVQDANKPFFGIGAEELDPSDWTADDIKLTLVTVTGSGVDAGGQFSLWNNSVFGVPNFLWSTADGISAADAVSIIAGSHGHFNIGFTQPGTYDVTLQVSGTHDVDGFVTGTATYHFDVVTPVPEPGTMAFGALAVLVMATHRRRTCVA
jgi:surface-anchored protein